MTIREHLEAIRDGMAALPVEATYRANREARAHAVAALRILDDPDLRENWAWVSVCDPMPDPDLASGRVAATPTTDKT